MRPSFARTIAFLAALAVVLVATLRPLPGGPYAVTWCLACGERGGADALRNVLLFVPLGIAACVWLRRAWIAVAVCAAMSLGIEIAQLWIPGRDPSVGDLAFNTLGAAAGVALAATARAWLRPGPRAAGRLSLAWAIVVWAAVAATGALLTPARGAVPMAGHEGDDMVLRVQTRAAAIGLDQPVVRWPGAAAGLSPGDGVQAWHSGAEWCLRAGGRVRCGLGATAGRAWAMLIYPDDLARRFGGWMDAAWVAVLFLPLGFWMRRGRMSLAAIVIALAALAILPKLGVLAATPVGEWIGAVMGIVVGMGIGRMVTRWYGRIDGGRPAWPAPPVRPVQPSG